MKHHKLGLVLAVLVAAVACKQQYVCSRTAAAAVDELCKGGIQRASTEQEIAAIQRACEILIEEQERGCR